MQNKSIRAIIINGPSCAGKSTIAKEICATLDKFVHLQIDKTGDFYGTIFPKGMKFVDNDPGTEDDDNGIKGLFNKNRLARRKVVASIMLATAEELLSQGFHIVVDTALDGPDAKELAQLYFNRLNRDQTLFVGIYCPLDERLNRLKTRSDNLFLTEEFVKLQSEKWNVFELCKDIYDMWFDSSKLNATEITKQIASKM
jgi:chloramphenicol 3-O phosphotransferase